MGPCCDAVACCWPHSPWLAAPALALEFPNRPIRLVVPFAPGGLTDIPARLVAAHMTRTLGQGVVVENRPGAAGTIGAALVRAAPADGYTLLAANAASNAQAPALRRNVGYNPVEDFAPVMLGVISPFALVVRADRPLRSMDDLIGLARREGRVTFGTTGPGGTGHILALMLTQQTGVTFEPIHFAGDAPAIQEVLAGRLDLHYAAAARPQVEAGRAVSGRDDRVGPLVGLPRGADPGRARLPRHGPGRLERAGRAARDASRDHRRAERRGQPRHP